MSMWGRCPKCQHHLVECTFVRPQGIQKSENCQACGWEEVLLVQVGGKGKWQPPDHTPIVELAVDDPKKNGRIRHAKVKV